MERELRNTLQTLRHTDEALQQKTDELADFLDAAMVGLHRVGPDGTILWANQAELDLLGYRLDEYVGRPIWEFHADRPVIEDILTRLARHERIEDVEARLRARDGSIKHVAISSNVFIKNGQFAYTRCITRDITAQKAADHARDIAARHSQRLMKITAAIADAVQREEVLDAVVNQTAEALGASSVGLWLVADDKQTATLARAVGYQEAALKAVRVLPLHGTPNAPVVDAIRTGQPIFTGTPEALIALYPNLAPLMSKGRRYRVSCLPIVVEGRILGCVGFTFECATPAEADDAAFMMLVVRYCGQALERLRLLDLERQSRARSELLHGLAAAVIRAKSAEHVFEAALDSIGEALGATRAAVLVCDADDVMRFKAWRGLSDGYRKAVEGHSPWPRDVRDPRPVLIPDVRLDPGLASFRPLIEAEGVRALGFFPLVSGERLVGKFMVYYSKPHIFSEPDMELAAAIANHVAAAVCRFSAEADLRETVHFNEMFTAILGHDLRNPLAAILASAHVAQRRSVNGPLSAPLERIINSGGRMARMIDQLLDFTRVRLGSGIPLSPLSTDVLRLIQDVIAELQEANPHRTVRLKHLGGATVGVWDADRLSQVFSNLVANALLHGAADAGVTVRVDGTSQGQLLVDVHNMGPIPPELLPRLFEPMTGARHRGESARGMGLGLHITREILAAHGGRISVHSSVDAGTTFRVVLPGAPGLAT